MWCSREARKDALMQQPRVISHQLRVDCRHGLVSPKIISIDSENPPNNIIHSEQRLSLGFPDSWMKINVLPTFFYLSHRIHSIRRNSQDNNRYHQSLHRVPIISTVYNFQSLVSNELIELVDVILTQIECITSVPPISPPTMPPMTTIRNERKFCKN